MAKPSHASERSRTGTYLNRTLKHTFFARPRPLHILMLFMFLVFGLALVTQVRAQNENPLDTLTETELVELLGELNARADLLREERTTLAAQLDELHSEADQRASADEAATKIRQQADIAAGLVPVVGPGVVIGVAGHDVELPAQVFVTVLAELRNAGAEAIEVNDVRLTLRSWFTVSDGHVVVDNQVITSPYTWRVIGDPDTLSSAIEIRGGAASQLRAFGTTVTIQKRDQVKIESVAEPFIPNWATVGNDQ